MCGVTECPVTNLFLRQQGVPGAEQGWHQRRPLLLPVISISDARLTYLQRLCKVLLARCFPRCVCFMLNLVTFSPLEGNLVPCEPRLIILETFRLYSRLISCTRKISILHLEFKCVCVCVRQCVLAFSAGRTAVPSSFNGRAKFSSWQGSFRQTSRYRDKCNTCLKKSSITHPSLLQLHFLLSSP